MKTFARDEFVSEKSCRPVSALGATRCFAAEGGTTGKNSSTDQRQIQATSQEGPVVGGDGSINTGSQLIGAGSTIQGSNLDIAVSDQGAIDRAFTFGENVLTTVGKVLATESATQASTVTANTDFLKAQTALLSANSAGGVTEAQTKTTLYIVGAAILGIVAIIFFLRR